MHVRDMYVAGTVLGMTSDGRTDTTGHFTPQTGTSPSRVNSVKPRTGREFVTLLAKAQYIQVAV